ncbi:hypothetical protein F2P79_013357 [Pimephales promelas]|nr:hypothetical protein F2P79_013357 [Pimephales promelas]
MRVAFGNGCLTRPWGAAPIRQNLIKRISDLLTASPEEKEGIVLRLANDLGESHTGLKRHEDSSGARGTEGTYSLGTEGL